jgi:hypothetical protein
MISEEKHTCGFNLSRKTKGDTTRSQTSPATGDSARNFDALNILLRSIGSSLRSAQLVARFARNSPAQYSLKFSGRIRHGVVKNVQNICPNIFIGENKGCSLNSSLDPLGI